jgi:hypothetical protein
MSAENYRGFGGDVVRALRTLKAVSGDPTSDKGDPGAGWTFVNDGENTLFVRTEEIPNPSDEHPLFRFDAANKTWSVKQESESSAEREKATIDLDKEPVSTVIISSGSEGVYEMHKAEAASFLFRNMNVVLFNFRGHGKSEGEPTERGLKMDMEAAYQLAKDRSGHQDSKILFKAFCMSGGPAAYVASKHPETNIFLDQTYSDFKTLVSERAESQIDECLTRALGKGDPATVRGKVLNMIKSGLNSISLKVISFIAPDFNTAKGLAAVNGHKAIFYAHDDGFVKFDHVANNIKAVADAGKMDCLMVLSGPGRHATSLLKVKSSPEQYQDQIKKKNQELDLLKKKRDGVIKVQQAQLGGEIAMLEKKGGDENVKKLKELRGQLEKLGQDMHSLEGEMAAHEKEKEQLLLEMGPNAQKNERTAMNQMSHFLTKAGLSDDILKSDTQLRQSNPAVLSEIQTTSNLDERMSSLANFVEEIAGRSKYLGDVYSLKVASGETSERVADEFVSVLLNASRANPPMSKFTFRGETIEDVEEKYRSSLEALNLRFQGSDASKWKEGLLDYISAKQSAAEGKIYICKPLRLAIENIESQRDADKVSFYLMSEVTSTKGGIRKLEMDKFKVLLADPRIAGTPMLKNAVLTAGKNVQLKAIRKAQANVVKVALHNDRSSRLAWEKVANRLENREENLDMLGIYAIAKEAKVKLPTNIANTETEIFENLLKDFSRLENLASLSQLG